MYTRSYYPDGRPLLPENYDGTAFIEAPPIQEAVEKQFTQNEGENPRQTAIETGGSVEKASGSIPILSGLFGRGGILGALNLKMPTIGTEEILIIATAAFLFFSKNGDKESALILLLLLLVA